MEKSKVYNRRRSLWRRKKEFVNVKEALFSGDFYKMKWAVDTIELWRRDSDPTLSTGVDVTVALVQAILEDKFVNKGEIYGDKLGLSLMYSTALTRFVNVTVECVQNYFVSSTVYAAASKLGIPDWIVDLRHKASHSTMPSLDCLRSGAQTALIWLQNEYWNKHVFLMEDVAGPGPVPSDDCDKYIESYKETNVKMLCNEISLEEESWLKSELNVILNQIRNKSQKWRDTFYGALLQPSVFFIESTQLPDFLFKDELHFLDTSTSSELTAKNFDLPWFIMQLWAPLIKTLNLIHQIPIFVIELLKCHRSLDPLNQKLACAWALKLVNMSIKGESKPSSEDPIAAIYKKQSWTFNWTTLTRECALHPSQYSAVVFNVVINRVVPPINPKVKKDLISVFAVQLNLSFPSYQSRSLTSQQPLQVFQILQNLQEEAILQHERKNSSRVALPPRTIWKHNGMKSSVPVGYVFGPDEKLIGNPEQPEIEECIVEAVKEQQRPLVKRHTATARKQFTVLSKTPRMITDVEKSSITEEDIF